jgi:hypothetical protein
VVVDCQVHRIPADAPVAVLALTCDAMADTIDATEPLGVDMKQFARALAFVTHHRFRRLQGRQAVQTQPPQMASDRCQAATCLTGDAPQWQPLSSALFELLHLLGRARPGTAARAGTTVQQPSRAFGLEAGQPFVGSAAAHPDGLSRSRHSPPLLEYPIDQQGSTCRRQSRMLMAVHPFSCPELLGPGNHSFPVLGRMNNLLRHHN